MVEYVIGQVADVLDVVDLLVRLVVTRMDICRREVSS
jgi:hypothetical protein